MAVTSEMVPLGSTAPDFTLPAVDGREVSLSDLSGTPALLVVFLCNHCPYVRHLESSLGATLAEYAARGLTTVGICPNDADSYPDDRPEKLAEQAARAGWTFPYLVDATQDVGRAYQAACTPDFFLYDAERKLAYRGAYDGSTPGNGVPVTGESLRDAIDRVLAGEPVPEPHRPSMGCSIKWRD
ncbi:MAG: thioredoxin family protein [Actinomycetota bacterium]